MPHSLRQSGENPNQLGWLLLCSRVDVPQLSEASGMVPTDLVKVEEAAENAGV